MILGGGLYGAYSWATAIVPGGEMRYQQFIRLRMERSGAGIGI
jgi:hypothetical protein